MYPLKFEPILKQTLWGGDKIIPFKHLNSDLKGVGESWEISGVEDNESVVANGPETNFHYSLSLLMPSRICPFRYTRPMTLRKNVTTQWVKQKCGMW